MGEPTASGTVEGGTLTTLRDAQVALDLCEGALQPRKAHRVSRIDGFTIVTGHFGGFGSQTHNSHDLDACARAPPLRLAASWCGGLQHYGILKHPFDPATMCNASSEKKQLSHGP